MIKEQLTKAELIDMELYEFFELLAKASISEVLTIKQTLVSAKETMLTLANRHKDKMFDFAPETFDPKVFSDEFTYTIQCAALALYLDKKITLCERREQDLTPDCFKQQDVDKK